MESTVNPDAPAQEPQPTPPPAQPQQTEAEKVDALIDAVQPPVKRREQVIKGGVGTPFEGFTRTYTQQKLSFFGKLEFVRLISKAINRAMGTEEGAEGIGLAQLMGAQNMAQDITTADAFIKALARIAEFAPEVIKDVYMISLNVPAHEREVVAEILDQPYDEDTKTGGLSDEDGFAILETFIAQNARVMRDFFQNDVPRLVKMAQEQIGDVQVQGPSKQ